MIVLLAMIGCLYATSGCATMINGLHQRVELSTVPAGATVRIEPGGTELKTPATAVLRRNRPYTVRVHLDGYQDRTETLRRRVSHGIVANILVGVVGAGVDFLTGAAWELQPNPLHVVLQPEGEGAADPPP